MRPVLVLLVALLISGSASVRAATARSASPDQLAQAGDRRVLVLLQGLGSSSVEFHSSSGTFGDLAHTLGIPNLKPHGDPYGVPYDDILLYSYAGHQGPADAFAPNEYACGATFRQSLATDVTFLRTLLEHYSAAYPGTQFDLIGYSLGGLIAWEYTKSLVGNQSGPRVRKVITIDSPLQGVAYDLLNRSTVRQTVVGIGGCAASDPSLLTDELPIFNDFAGLSANQEILLANNRQSAALLYAGQGTHLHTLTNLQDMIVPWWPCEPPIEARDCLPDGAWLVAPADKNRLHSSLIPWDAAHVHTWSHFSPNPVAAHAWVLTNRSNGPQHIRTVLEDGWLNGTPPSGD